VKTLGIKMPMLQLQWLVPNTPTVMDTQLISRAQKPPPIPADEQRTKSTTNWPDSASYQSFFDIDTAEFINARKEITLL